MNTYSVISYIESISKIIQTIVVTAGIIVGFFTWRSQLLKKKKYEVARQLFQSVISIKTQLNKFRSPFVSSGEQAEAIKNQGLEPSTDLSKYTSQGSAAVFRERWQIVFQKYNQYELYKIEAKATLDCDLDLITKSFESKIKEIWSATTMFISHYDRLANGLKGMITNPMYLDMSKKVYASFQLENEIDTFEKEITDSIKAIKEGLKKFLSLK